MSVLAIEGLTLSCRVGNHTVEVLRDVSLNLDKGRVLGLVGESGAGKSMIGRVIAGHLPAGFAVTRGTVGFEGGDLRALAPAAWRALLGRRIAFIPQEPLTALNPVLTVGQTFAEHLMLLGIARGARAATALQALSSVRLPAPHEIVCRYPHQLSGGQCQRVLIAMAFVANPALIVADEPTTALDVVSQAHILSLLEEQRAGHGTALLLITHDLRLAAHVCDQVAVLYAGELAELGPARQVLGRSRHPYTWALQHATPDVHGPQRVLPALAGHMPGVESLAGFKGCRFAARCPRRQDACERAPQPLLTRAGGHRVRCLAPIGEGEAAAVPAGGDFVPPAGDGGARPLVELRNVSLRYTARRGLLGQRRFHTVAVDRVSFQVHPGEFVGIVGASGSGKSSLARMIVGAARPTAGQVLIDGADRAQAPAAVLALQRAQVQMIFQDPHSALNPRRSVLRLLTQVYESAQATPDPAPGARAARAAELLGEVGLPLDLLGRYPSQLSGGQKQRVNIGRALCATPRLIVADEIVSGLDVSIQAQILNLLLELGRELHIALILISHDLSVVRYLCSRVLVMQQGRVVEEGETARVFARPGHPYTRELLSVIPPADASRGWRPFADAAQPLLR